LIVYCTAGGERDILKASQHAHPKAPSTRMKFATFLLRFGRSSAFVLLAAVFVVLVVAGFFTRGGDPSLEYNAPPRLPNTSGLVDQSPLATARNLASLAATAQEQQYASEALRFSDHEVDQAFASALRESSTHQQPLTGQALAISRRIDALNRHILDEQQEVDRLTQAQSKKATPDGADDLELLQAQLALDQDQLQDLHLELVGVGGDRHASIQQALDEHDALQKQADAIPRNTGTAQLETPDALVTLAGKLRAWSSLNQRHQLLQDAGRQTQQLIATLTRQHDQLENLTEAGTSQAPATDPSDAHAAAISRLHGLADERKSLAEIDTRIHDLQQLATVYRDWDTLVRSQKLTILHRMLRVFAFITLLVILVLGVDVAIRRFFHARIPDRRRLHHMRVILELAVQLAGLALILIIIFGPPRQMPTIIGLATAGLTVVLKDFIVAFFGWFVLMGKNGIRVGDWVEINGVSGEVLDIGLLRTTLLETGNWTDPGHPTGRRVTLMNGFAIEGHYFNFSTTGQWLWDELRVTVPPGQEAYNTIDAIKQAVETRTREDATLAETEWKRATGSYGVTAFSATPSIDLRPSISGIDVVVRYMTRAQKRLEMRTELYQDAIEILHYAGAVETAPTAGR
jgi:small-conductance mechanosensitive channel